MQDKHPYNKQGRPHGYWEQYWNDDKLGYKTHFVNGVEYGYEEWGNGAKLYYAR